MSQQNEQPVQNEQPLEPQEHQYQQQYQQQNMDFPQGEEQQVEEKGGVFSYLKKHPMRVVLILLLLVALVLGALYMFKPSLVQGFLKIDKKVE